MSLTSLLLLLAACDLAQDPCAADLAAWEDNDGDGFGGASLGKVCRLKDGQVEVAQDCDDADPLRNPAAVEVCDGIDDDCDGQIDDDAGLRRFYFDRDGDSFGADYQAQLACASPGPGWVGNSADCDDRDPAVNPDATEVCGQVDEDCDGYVDESDDSVDPASFSTFYADVDGDGFGDAGESLERCRLIAGYVLEGNDCNDRDPQLTQRDYWADADGDGYGDPEALVKGCRNPPSGAVDNDLDCDDSDVDLTYASDWFEDVDGDGFGAGVSEGFACAPPTTHSVRENGDCDPLASDIYPSAPITCGDGIDQSCSGFDSCPSCEDMLASEPSLPSGAYSIQPQDGVSTVVWCDMDTDGGGWTLVGSTRSTTFDDAGTETAYDDLQTLVPLSGHSEIWSGLRSTLLDAGGRSDIRFACKVNANDPTFDVDLSFYDTSWYVEITTGADSESCFNDSNGAGADPPPARRDNVSGASLPAGDQWAAGFLEGEDSCSDDGDFTVDFDDRGMDNNQNDGTDWGEDDSSPKCGFTNGDAWFILVR